MSTTAIFRLAAWINAFVAGSLFAAGLLVSGMVRPDKVLAFLDLFGAWDPSLALVMGAAIAVAAPAFAWGRHRGRDLAGKPLGLPPGKGVERRLLLGSAMFGVGWGLVGLCPGPALACLGLASPAALAFVSTMVLGLYLPGSPGSRSGDGGSGSLGQGI